MQTRRSAQVEPVPPRLRWWHEVIYVWLFYFVYSYVRNQFGSQVVSPERALKHAERIIDIEQAMGLFFEQQMQGWFLDWGLFLRIMNIYYGTFHFYVPIFALAFLYTRHPADYPKWRNTLGITTGLALVGFATFPLMPPRLLDRCTKYGGCLNDSYTFVDTLAVHGGWFSFDSGAVADVSNQYAAMPSLHFGWSMWCCLVLFPRLKSRLGRVLIAIYPALTLFAIIVTANHYWIDALGGAIVLAIGYYAGASLANATALLRGRWRSRITLGDDEL